MFRHQHKARYHKAVPRTHDLKLTLEDAIGLRRVQQRLAPITTEGHKVKTAALLVTDELRHDDRILHRSDGRDSWKPTLRQKKAKDGPPTSLTGKGCATRRPLIAKNAMNGAQPFVV